MFLSIWKKCCMNIYSVNDNYNISMQGKNKNPNWVKRQIRRAKQYFLDKSPSATSKEGEKSRENWDKISHWVGDPMWNRGIMGATALLSQPAIDYYNHRVDDETRTVSRNRTISKIIAGTLVGMFVVRGPVSKIVDKMTNPEAKSKWGKILLPKNYIDKMRRDSGGLKNYRATISMILALSAMCFTNFLLDAPLTNFFTNYLNKKSGVGKIGADAKTEGINNIDNTNLRPDTEQERKEAGSA